MSPVWCRRTYAPILGAVLAACAHPTPPQVPAAPKAEAAPPSVDAVGQRIAEADAHLAAGLTEAKEGHLNRAREEFDRAVDLYLTAPGGANAEPRLAEAYRRTLDTVQAREIEAFAAGDAFRETDAETASIDEVAELTVAETAASEETRAKAEEAVHTEANDFPVELNDPVLACIDLYQGRLREWFQSALDRGQRYLPSIREVFKSEGIPQDLAYVALVESAFKPAAYSRARAKGVWQFISSTGKLYGLQQDWWVDERSDTEKATRAAARYLKQLYETFGDWNLAMAAYNAGPRKVERGIRRYKTEDYWELRKTRAFKRETRNYVPLIHAAVVVANAPEKYGFEVSAVGAESAPEYETGPVEGAIDLRVIAECLETPVDEIRALNPTLRRLATPANRTFELRVPFGKGEALAPCLASIPPEKRVRFRTHVVARGQTFSSIAKANGVRARDVAEANNLPLRKRLRVGTELIIPISTHAKPASTKRSAKAPKVELSEKSWRIAYRVKPGDTLGAIASQYGATVREIQSWNGLRGSRITAGNVLTIYSTALKGARDRESGGPASAPNPVR